MASIILDCDLMRNHYSGLYNYCLNIGLSVNKHLAKAGRDGMKMYIPYDERNSFANAADTIVSKPWHKIYAPFLSGCTVWHAPFQLGRILPVQWMYPAVKVVLTIHDLNILHEDNPLPRQRRTMHHIQSLIDRSDAIVCISAFTKSDVLKHCDTGIKPIYVIHNGVHRINEAPQALSTKKTHRPFIFAMGYVNAKKNFHVLIPLLWNNPGIDLIIAGIPDDPDYVDKIKKEAVISGVSDRLFLTGAVSEDDKAWYFKHCLAFMHPSLAEGFGAPVVEAMTFGKPIFISARTSLPEIAGSVAFYFNSFDAEHMQQVFVEGMEYYGKTGMSERVINCARKYDWEKSAAKYVEVYDTLL